MDVAANPILKQFRDGLTALYGHRLQRAVLYGSRARGDARPDSDYDIAVFLRDVLDRAHEMNRLADLSTAILYDQGVCIHAMLHRESAYEERTPLMHEIRRDGLDL